MKDFVDDLYRQASENPDIPFNEAAWDQMEQKLDLAERKRRRGLFWLFFWLFVTLGIGLLWGLQRLKPQVPTAKPPQGPIARSVDPTQRNRVQTKDTTSATVIGPADPKPSKAPAVTSVQPSAQVAQLPQTTNLAKRNSTAPTTPGAAQDRSNRPALSPAQWPTATRPRTNPAEPGQAGLAATTPVAKTPLDPNPTTPISPDSSAQPQETAWPVLDLLATRDPLAIDPTPYRLDTLRALASQPVARPRNPMNQGRWGLGLSAGPDLASVNANGSTAYGLNAGFAIDYRAGKRWGIQAAAQYLLKNYIADQREYIAPRGFWPVKNYPYSTEGTCDMLQWSLDVRYNWIARPKWNAFVQAGSSSWTILREHYEFYYNNYLHGQINEWASGQNKNYWFAQTQLGLGLERNLRPGLSVQVNWFAQAPLRGVGNGKVEIFSSGLGFMLRKELTPRIRNTVPF